jgi:hypothetical protein
MLSAELGLRLRGEDAQQSILGRSRSVRQRSFCPNRTRRDDNNSMMVLLRSRQDPASRSQSRWLAHDS